MASIVGFASKNLISNVMRSRMNKTSLRLFSTTRKNNSNPTGKKSDIITPPDFSKPLENENWVSFGFDYEDRKKDTVAMHGTIFFSLTLALIGGAFFIAYWPDYEHREWAKREAFIRLCERERLGLDPIDKNYVDPANIVLPSDEELGDFEIII